MEVPWRFFRDQAKLQLRSLRSHYNLYPLLATKALPLRSWRFICVSSAFMLLSWRLNHALPIICQHSKHFTTRFSRFLQNATHQKLTGELHSQALSGGYFHLVWTAGQVCQLPLPRLLLPKLLLLPPPECRAEVAVENEQHGE